MRKTTVAISPIWEVRKLSLCCGTDYYLRSCSVVANYGLLHDSVSNRCDYVDKGICLKWGCPLWLSALGCVLSCCLRVEHIMYPSKLRFCNFLHNRRRD